MIYDVCLVAMTHMYLCTEVKVHFQKCPCSHLTSHTSLSQCFQELLHRHAVQSFINTKIHQNIYPWNIQKNHRVHSVLQNVVFSVSHYCLSPKLLHGYQQAKQSHLNLYILTVLHKLFGLFICLFYQLSRTVANLHFYGILENFR